MRSIKIETPASINKVFNYFASHDRHEYARPYEWDEIINGLVQKAAKAYSKDYTIFDSILSLYKSSGHTYDQLTAKMLLPFFEETKTTVDAFFGIFHKSELPDYEKAFLLGLLLNDEVLIACISAYANRNLTNEEFVYIHQLLLWHSDVNTNREELLLKLEEQAIEIGSLQLQRPKPIDYQAIHKEREQHSFDLLFDANRLKIEVIKAFESFNKPEVTSEDMFALTKTEFENRVWLPQSVSDILWDFVRGKAASLHNILKFLDNDKDFENYRVGEIHQIIQNKEKTISEAQIDFLKSWVDKTLPLLDISKAIHATNAERTSWNTNRYTEYCWYFIRRFKFVIPENKALDFTLFWDFRTRNDEKQRSIINDLEEFVSKDSLKKRVIQNLKGEFEADELWRNNALYAFSKRIKAAYPLILQKLRDEQISIYTRDEVAKAFLEKTNDVNSLLKIVVESALTKFHWNTIRLIIPKATDDMILISHLKNILSNEANSIENRILAAKDLMRLNNLDGLVFYANYLDKAQKPDDDYQYSSAGLDGIKDAAALSTLMRLLALSKQSAFQQDDFNSLEARILDTLFNIGIASKENLELVKTAFGQFITDNTGKIPNVNFLFTSMQRMEAHFYEQQSQTMTLSKAIANVNQLNKEVS